MSDFSLISNYILKQFIQRKVFPKMRNPGMKDFSLIFNEIFNKEFIKENAVSHCKLRTVQHFCNPEEQKCCTVPKFLVPRHKNLGTVQHFCSSGLQKCCTVPKFLCLGTKNLGTVQHFCNPEEQK